MSEDKRLNEVIRVQKKANNFVMMDKSFLEDKRLSYKAKGILAYLLSKPDNWKVIIGNLVSRSTDGKASVYAGLKELKECGYYEKNPIRNESGTRIIRWESTVYEIPLSLLTDFKEIEDQNIENQFLGNRGHNNNNYNNKLNINNNHSSLVSQTIDNYLSLIRENIGYHDLQITHADDMELINEFISIALDAIVSDSKTVRIRGEDKPREIVRANLLKLRYDNIVHVLDQFKKLDQRIRNKPQYILSMLYYSPMELEAHYTNLVKSDIFRTIENDG